jgi:glycosyltransferase involved in cell wall biosynthesis
MHILLIHQAFAAVHEPGGTRHHELALLLAEQGHQVTIIASSVSYLTGRAGGENQAPAETVPGVTVLRAYTYSALHKSFVHRIFSFVSFMVSSFLMGLRVKDVDLVWGTSPPIFQGATAWALARLKRVHFLFEIRDLWPAFAVAVGVLTQPLLIRLSEWLERFLYQRADTLMINSPGFESHVRERGARSVVLVPNGADPRMFNPQDDGAAFREAHGLVGKYVALYAGAHGLSNDLGVLLQAAELLSDRPEVALVLLGDGKDKANLQRRAAEKGLENVYFVPPIPKREMGEALAAADACVGILKPVALYATVYPNKIFDYMAAGRPVILAMEGVIREVVESALAGLPVPPGDPEKLAQAVRQLAQDPEAGRAMGAAGRAHIEAHFDRAKLALQLADMITKVHDA